MKDFAEIEVEQEALDYIKEESYDYDRTLYELCHDIVNDNDDPLKALDKI